MPLSGVAFGTVRPEAPSRFPPRETEPVPAKPRRVSRISPNGQALAPSLAFPMTRKRPREISWPAGKGALMRPPAGRDSGVRGQMPMKEFAHGTRLLSPRAAGAFAVGHSESRIVADCVMPARFRVSLQLTECASFTGPLIALQASLVLPGLQARITFRDRPHRDDVPFQEVSSVVPLVLPGERLERPLISTRGAPAPARLTLHLRDCIRQPLVPPQEIECVPGSRQLDVPI